MSITDLKIDEEKEQKALGTRIKKLRGKYGHTQRYMSDRMNIDVANYQRIERGATNPTYKTLLLIVNSMGSSLQELFSDDLINRSSPN